MKNVLVFSCLAVTLVASQALARTERMRKIEDAGIYCASFDRKIANFYPLAKSRCSGKFSCAMRATMVTTKADLIRHQCTGFFVAPVCHGAPVSHETHNILETLHVSCARAEVRRGFTP
ncbi:hypothetical protein B1812_12170 [Methylocystis bryophila]|uniref:YARHG domain-containing protein n=2 Tax=Methylocystis bryophila TaxID=655015 RepID=A0A1W6MW04_9HYPH|nr:hypothetical protein B1812_12170 [Methylocystis bryophila]